MLVIGMCRKLLGYAMFLFFYLSNMNVYTVPYLDACPFSKLMKYDSFQEVKALKDLMYKKYIVQIKITKF